MNRYSVIDVTQAIAAPCQVFPADVSKAASLFGTAVHAVLRGTAVDSAEIATRLRARGIAVYSLDGVPPSLEDVFLEVVERSTAQKPAVA